MLHQIHVTFQKKYILTLAIGTKSIGNTLLNFVTEIIAYTCQTRYRNWMKEINVLENEKQLFQVIFELVENKIILTATDNKNI